MRNRFVKVKEVDGVELFVNKPVTYTSVCGEGGHFEDIHTGENLGKEAQNYVSYHDDNLNILQTPTKENIRWVRDNG